MNLQESIERSIADGVIHYMKAHKHLGKEDVAECVGDALDDLGGDSMAEYLGHKEEDDFCKSVLDMVRCGVDESKIKRLVVRGLPKPKKPKAKKGKSK